MKYGNRKGYGENKEKKKLNTLPFAYSPHPLRLKFRSVFHFSEICPKNRNELQIAALAAHFENS